MDIYTIGYENETLTAHLVVNRLIQKQVSRSTSYGFVEISKCELQRLHWKGHETMKRLVRDGLVECDNLFLASNITDNPKSLGYRFTHKGINELKLLRLNPDDYHVLAWRSYASKVQDNPRNRSRDSDITSALFEYVKRASLDVSTIVDSDLDAQQMLTPLQLINHSPFIKRTDTELRVHSSFSLMPSVIKPHVRLMGSPIVELDITASNPFLLALHLMSALSSPSASGTSSLMRSAYGILRSHSSLFSSQRLPLSLMRKGFGEFINGSLTGEIYNLLADTLQPHYQKELTRDDGKKWMMLLMNESTAALERYDRYAAIKERFPVTIQLLEILKEDKRLGVELMREESRMVIDTICADLLNYDIPFLTAHDAIWTPPQFAPAVKKKMKEHYTSRYGIAPNITIE